MSAVRRLVLSVTLTYIIFNAEVASIMSITSSNIATYALFMLQVMCVQDLSTDAAVALGCRVLIIVNSGLV